MPTLRTINDYEARARDVKLEDVTSSKYNAVILEKLRNNDDACKGIEISGEDHDWVDENDFVVREGDDVGWLGYFIGKSERLESLGISHLPDEESFRQGLAQNQSIQVLYICNDTGFQSLAPFFQNTNTLKELVFPGTNISLECAQNIALLLSRCQIKSLKSIELEENELSDEGFVEIARALNAQPQLEKLHLNNLNLGIIPRGYAALGATMKSWESPSLKKLDLQGSDIDDDGLEALVEGMANCFNLEHLNLAVNDSITVVGLRALSALFRCQKFC